ncbi:aminotransferase class I/II-fold pyridoxal phosphate-dependent enzyme [Lichenicola sp.]|uniref:aminotransferase class I/II-fold pyridoxal phosphate-dependent enzyme n=1 Tax=Lichenicola sp. TaxID=2804529 RepID=UPI003B0033B0
MSCLDPMLDAALRELGRQRQLRTLVPGSPSSGHVMRGGRMLLNASANDYLGLAQHPLLAERAAEWGARHGTGAGASRLVTGTFELHRRVESRLAAFKQTEAALLFASGWQANAAVLPALLKVARAGAGAAPTVFADRLIHASLHHGIQAAGIRQVRFRHNDLEQLEAMLADHAGQSGQCFIVTESVFSMDGDRADIGRLRAIAARHRAFLYVDEAHATGVLGPAGAGLSVEAGGVDLVMGTFSKAFGSFGAYVAGSQVLCDYLVNACSGFIHTTALPPPVLGAIDAALDLVPGMDPDRARVAAAADRLRAALLEFGIDTAGSTTQIVPVLVGDAAAALDLAAAMERLGVLGVAIRPPTVPPGRSRIRLALSAGHDEADLERIIAALAAGLVETGLSPGAGR